MALGSELGQIVAMVPAILVMLVVAMRFTVDIHSAPQKTNRQVNVSKTSFSYSLDVILVIFDPSRPIPPIRPFWENTKA